MAKTIKRHGTNGKEFNYIINPTKDDVKHESELVRENVMIVNKKYFGTDTIPFLSWFKDIEQPDSYTISRALLWGINEYSIKVASYGGYESSLCTTICVNDRDKDVPLIKKWGNKLEDVLITYDEITWLYEQLETNNQKRERIKLESVSAVKLYVRTALLNKTKDLPKLEKILLNYPKEHILGAVELFKKDNYKYLEMYKEPEKHFITSKNATPEYWKLQQRDCMDKIAVLVQIEGIIKRNNP